MGLFSGLKGFHGAGEAPSDNTVQKYGPPAYSLYMESKFTLNNRVEITDENGNVKYSTSSKIASIKGKTDVYNSAETLVAHIEKKPVSMHEKHFIQMADGREFTLSNELFHIVKDITNIEGLGWRLEGNIAGMNFGLLDQYGEPVAAISQKMISLHNKYSIDIYKQDQEAVVAAIVIALGKMLESRRENSSEGGFSFSFGE